MCIPKANNVTLYQKLCTSSDSVPFTKSIMNTYKWSNGGYYVLAMEDALVLSMSRRNRWLPLCTCKMFSDTKMYYSNRQLSETSGFPCAVNTTNIQRNHQGYKWLQPTAQRQTVKTFKYLKMATSTNMEPFESAFFIAWHILVNNTLWDGSNACNFLRFICLTSVMMTGIGPLQGRPGWAQRWSDAARYQAIA